MKYKLREARIGYLEEDEVELPNGSIILEALHFKALEDKGVILDYGQWKIFYLEPVKYKVI